MSKWFNDVMGRTMVQTKGSLARWNPLLLLGFFGMIAFAIIFAVRDYGNVNVLLALIVGFLTGSVFLVLSYGPIALYLFLEAFFSHLSGQQNPTARVQTIAVIAALIVVTATWATAFGVATHIPIGQQGTYMFRDD